MNFPADITLRKTRMKFELTFKVVLLFSYQGFAFMRKLLHFITSTFVCQELFSSFFKVFRTLSDFRTVLKISDCRLCSSDLITLTYPFQVVKHFFKFLFYFRNLFKLSLFKKQLFPTAQLIYHQKFTMSTVNFII